jgi:hypothetical protein
LSSSERCSIVSGDMCRNLVTVKTSLGLPHQRSKNGRASLEAMLPAAGSTHESCDADSRQQRGHADPHGIHLAQDRRTGLTQDVRRLFSDRCRRPCNTISFQATPTPLSQTNREASPHRVHLRVPFVSRRNTVQGHHGRSAFRLACSQPPQPRQSESVWLVGL